MIRSANTLPTPGSASRACTDALLMLVLGRQESLIIEMLLLVWMEGESRMFSNRKSEEIKHIINRVMIMFFLMSHLLKVIGKRTAFLRSS